MARFYEDPILDYLRRRERAIENFYFAARDRELLERLHERQEWNRSERLRERIGGRCPECVAPLMSRTRHGVTVEECPFGHGMWTTPQKARLLARRERDSGIGRYLYAPRPVV